MKSIVYSSVANASFSPAELDELLDKSRHNNARRELTGVLVHHKDQFMQVLEGPEDQVEGLLATISADPRHSGVWMLHSERITARRFPNWSMELRRVGADEIPGFPGEEVYSLDQHFATPSRATALLDWFRSR